MKISDTSFLKTIPVLCQPLPFYGKNMKPLFCENFQNSSPPTKTGTEGPPMKTSGIDQISAKFLKDGAPVIAIQLQL